MRSWTPVEADVIWQGRINWPGCRFRVKLHKEKWPVNLAIQRSLLDFQKAVRVMMGKEALWECAEKTWWQEDSATKDNSLGKFFYKDDQINGQWFEEDRQSRKTGAAAKSLQSCPTLCNPIDGSPPCSPVPGILQARTLEWVAISFSNASKWKVKVKSLSRVRLFTTSWTAAYRAPPSMGFSRQEYWSGVPLPSPPERLFYL